ncbi:MAG: plastocyanin/azurin family copper-binding protein [Paracoccaceae bacterium]
MRLTRRTALAAIASLPALAHAGIAVAAETASTVTLSLWDKGPTSMDMMDTHPMMGMAMMKGADMSVVTMGIKADVSSIPAGEITFTVANDSKDMVHEMIVAPISSDATALPYLADEEAVDEDAAGAIGEVSELDPGKAGTLTLHLQPGEYILFCNIPGHYALGMWTLLTVTG